MGTGSLDTETEKPVLQESALDLGLSAHIMLSYYIEMRSKQKKRNHDAHLPQRKTGMTLVEILLAVALIAMLAVLMAPALQLSIRSRQNAQCANKLYAAVQAYETFFSERGGYPPDESPGAIPAIMGDYYYPYFGLDDWWTGATELGGQWDWDVGYHGFAASVSISNPTVSEKQLIEFDRLVDDGDLTTGRLRLVGQQLHYILEE
jgi:prepilin-type N-terminal cleavage/methylation domain-containing protein